jgi:uncharacterized membrane protein YcgQ (UPF0703/DUF1980 family)
VRSNEWAFLRLIVIVALADATVIALLLAFVRAL